MDARLLGVALGRGLVRPVPAVRQTDELGWRGSLVVHVVGLMMLAGVAVLAGLAVSGAGYRAGSEAWDSLAMRFGPVAWLAFVPMVLGSGVDDIAGQVGVPRGLIVLAFLGIFTAMMEVVVLLAVLLWGWAARPDERVRESFDRARLRLWRLTPAVATLVLGMSVVHLGVYTVLDLMSGGLMNADPDVIGIMSSGWEAYDAWWETWTIVTLLLWVVAGVGVLWVLVAGVRPGGVGRAGDTATEVAAPVAGAGVVMGREARCRWPAVCEECGYSLLGVSWERDCPECGRLVEASLGEDVRPGTPWQRAASALRVGAWLRTAARAVLGPRRLGWSMRVMDSRPDRAVAGLMWGAGLVMVLGAIMLPISLTVHWVVLLSIDRYSDWFPPWDVLLMLIVSGAIRGVLMALVVGGPVAAIQSVVLKRNVMPAAAEAGGYVMGWFVVWGIVSGVVALAFNVVLMWISRDTSASMMSTIFNAIALLLWGMWLLGVLIAVWLQLRVAGGTRYANR